MSQDYQTPSNFTHSTTNESVSPNTITSGHGSILILKSGHNNNSITDSKPDCENYNIIEYEEFQQDWKFRKLSFSEASQSQEQNNQKYFQAKMDYSNGNQSEFNQPQISQIQQQNSQQKQTIQQNNNINENVINSQILTNKSQKQLLLQQKEVNIQNYNSNNQIQSDISQQKQSYSIQTQTEEMIETQINQQKQETLNQNQEKIIEKVDIQVQKFVNNNNECGHSSDNNNNIKQYQFLNELLLPPQINNNQDQQDQQAKINNYNSNKYPQTQHTHDNLKIFIEEESQNNLNKESNFEETLDLNAEKDVQLIKNNLNNRESNRQHSLNQNSEKIQLQQQYKSNGHQNQRQSSTTVRERQCYFQEEPIICRKDQGQKDFFLSTGSISSLKILNSSQNLNSSMKINTQSIKQNISKFNNTDEIDKNLFQQVKREDQYIREIQFLKREVVKLNQNLKEKDLENMKFRDKIDIQTDLIMNLEEKLYRLEEENKYQQNHYEINDQKFEKIRQENEKLYKKKENLKNILKERDKEIQLLKNSIKDNYIEEENNLLKQRVQYFATLLESHDENLREKELQHKNIINQIKEQTCLELKNKCTENELLMLENKKLKEKLDDIKNQFLQLQNERQSWLLKEDNGITNYQQQTAGISTFSSSSHKKSTATYYDSYSQMAMKKPSPPSKQSSLIKSCEFASTNASSTQKSSANSTSMISYNNSKNLTYMKSLFDSELRQISVQSDQITDKEQQQQQQQQYNIVQNNMKQIQNRNNTQKQQQTRMDNQCIISKFLDDSNQYLKFIDSPSSSKIIDNNKIACQHSNNNNMEQTQQQSNQSFDFARDYISVPTNNVCNYELCNKFKRRGGISENSFQNEGNTCGNENHNGYSSSQKAFKKPPRVDSIPRNIGRERPPLTTINFNKKQQ